jgi:transcriptional regulator with XRE-family HTH domain
MDKYTLAERLKAYRKMFKMSQSELAEKVGCDQTSISAWERGRSVPNADILIDISDKLGLSVSELCGFDDKGMEDKAIIDAYHRAEKGIQDAVKKLLGLNV